VKTDAVVNVRFIAATNRDPIEAIEDGQLRKDLHYRLRVVPIHIPPLRERPDDIPHMALRFLREFWAVHRDASAAPPRFSKGAIEALRRAPWPGNVRELRNVVEHLTVLVAPGADVEAAEIPFIDDQPHTVQEPTPFYGEGVMDLDYRTAREKVVGEFETAYLRHVVRQAGGNISDAAKLAGVDRTTLYRLMEKHGTRRDSLIREAEVAGDAMH
jgi:DNA-binding NtrC family response regulator